MSRACSPPCLPLAAVVCLGGALLSLFPRPHMALALWLLTPLAAPSGEGQGQAAIAPEVDPFTDPATGRVINRWNKA